MQKLKNTLLWLGGLAIAALSIIVYFLKGKRDRLNAQERVKEAQKASDAIDDKVEAIDAEIKAIDAKEDDSKDPVDFWNKL